jgi:hypothetical protein
VMLHFWAGWYNELRFIRMDVRFIDMPARRSYRVRSVDSVLRDWPVCQFSHRRLHR